MPRWWRDINTPDNFARDWYGELTNQCAHTLLGMCAAVIWCLSAYAIVGSMPYRSWAFIGLTAGYLAVEIAVQKWRAGDSWFDSAMFGAGVAGGLLPFEETGIQEGLVLLTFDPLIMGVIVFLWSTALFLRVRRRYLASGSTQNE